MEIMLDDLKTEKKAEVLEFLGLSSPKEGNYDVVPLFIITDIQTINDTEKKNYDRVVISLLVSKQKRRENCLYGGKSIKTKA